MEAVRKVAVICVARAVMFGTLAIVCIMFAFSFNPPAAFRAGAVLTLGMAAVLLLKAHHVLRQQPKHTEVWLYLNERFRPRDDEGTRLYTAVLREVYGRFALGTFTVACGLFVVSALMIAAGLEMQGFQPVAR